MSTSESSVGLEKRMEFDQLKLRLLVGFVAFLLPILTPAISSIPLASISASYYTEARDIFVGLSFVIATILLAYNGPAQLPFKEQEENSFRKIVRKILRVDKINEHGAISTIGSLAAFVAALYPTACEGCGANPKSVVHYFAAGILFLITAYFCLVFRNSANAKAKDNEKLGRIATKQKRRAAFYFGCGWGIVACMLVAVVAQFTLLPETRSALAVTFIAETAALWIFAACWLIASRWFPYFADPDERLKLMQAAPQDTGQEAKASA